MDVNLTFFGELRDRAYVETKTFTTLSKLKILQIKPLIFESRKKL